MHPTASRLLTLDPRRFTLKVDVIDDLSLTFLFGVIVPPLLLPWMIGWHSFATVAPAGGQRRMSCTELSDDRLARLKGCEERIGYVFSDLGFLESALTHASGADHRLASNERMEFLGDAILGSVVCERLYRMYPEFLEGELTRLKSIVVSRETCAKVSKAMELEEFMILGKGMTTHPTIPPSVLAAVLESLVAAVFLDGGIDSAQAFILRCIDPEIELAAAGEMGMNYKSQLQQFAQRIHGVTPNYRLLEQKGPDHSKCFHIAAAIGERQFAAAWGKSKKEAEQKAAANAMADMNGQEQVFDSDTL